MHARSLMLASLALASCFLGCSAADDAASPDATGTPAAASVVERVLVAHLVVVVPDVDRAADRAEALVRAHEGDTERIEVSGGRAQLTLRVPASALPELERALATLGTILERARSSEDVTAPHAEARARIDVRRAEQARLTAMLESRTSTLAEVLDVERELTRVTESLDVLEADERSLASRVAFARVELTIVPAAREEGIEQLPSAALEGLALAGRVLLGLAQVVLFAGPSVLALALVARGILALARRLRRPSGAS